MIEFLNYFYLARRKGLKGKSKSLLLGSQHCKGSKPIPNDRFPVFGRKGLKGQTGWIILIFTILFVAVMIFLVIHTIGGENVITKGGSEITSITKNLIPGK